MIIKSILDNDFYKFTMQHAVVKLFPRAKAKYAFINRGKHEYPAGFADALQAEIEAMGQLGLTIEEKRFLEQNCPYLDPTYLDFLQGFRYDASEVMVTQNGGDLDIQIEGYWYRTILWEVPLMFLVCELYYKLTGQEREHDAFVIQTTKEKAAKYQALGINYADFGTRRRHSFEVQDLVVKTLKEVGGANFVGTSNVYFAMINNVKPIGTHAHEWFMFHGAKYGYKMANQIALDNWVNVYRGDLGIALSDTYTSEVFYGQFDKKLSRLFDGVRHDSGDPLDFADMTIAHYESLGIDPMSKTIIFSDGLDADKVARIVAHCKDRIGISFGIGTNFTNDVGLKAMNIVIKMKQALPYEDHWSDVVKLSDEPHKHTGTEQAIRLAKEILMIQD